MRRVLAAVAVGAAMLATATPAGPVAASSSDQGAGAATTAEVEALSKGPGGRYVHCPPIQVDSRGRASGGCLLHATGNGVVLRVHTLVGQFRFSRCLFIFDLRVDGTGRTLITNVSVEGLSPCSDADSCTSHGDSGQWWGRIRRAPHGLRIDHARVCFDTCIGRFEGPVTVRLDRPASLRRLTAIEEPVGASGWELDGEWVLTGRQVKVRSGPD